MIIDPNCKIGEDLLVGARHGHRLHPVASARGRRSGPAGIDPRRSGSPTQRHAQPDSVGLGAAAQPRHAADPCTDKVAQLEENLVAAAIRLKEEDVRALNEADRQYKGRSSG
jgi:hypothetical protein